MSDKKQAGIFIPMDIAQNLMKDIEQMRTIYADQTRSDWWDADDIAKDVAEQLGELIEKQKEATPALADRANGAKEVSEGMAQDTPERNFDMDAR